MTSSKSGEATEAAPAPGLPPEAKCGSADNYTRQEPAAEFEAKAVPGQPSAAANEEQGPSKPGVPLPDHVAPDVGQPCSQQENAAQQAASPASQPSQGPRGAPREGVPHMKEEPTAHIVAAPSSGALGLYPQQQQQRQQQQHMMALPQAQQAPPQGSLPDRQPMKQELRQLPQGPSAAARPRGQQRKCVECGSTDTPMWRTHPVHGRGTLCNACGVKLYRQQCKDRSQREKQIMDSGAWPSSAAQGMGGLAGGDERGIKRQKFSLSPGEPQRQQLEGWGRGLGGGGAYGSAQLPNGGSAGAQAAMLAPVLAKALAASAMGGMEGSAGGLAPSMNVSLQHRHSPLQQQQQQPDPGIPGCQFAFRGQLPDGTIEPRAIHDVTITLHTPRDPGSNITQSSLVVLDSTGGKLASYHTAELEPRLEYDQYLNAAVWDSRDGWWLLLPTPDHALAFQGLMRVLAARKLGMMQPPPLPEPPVQQPKLQQAPLAPPAAAAALQQRQYPSAPHQALPTAQPGPLQRQGPPMSQQQQQQQPPATVPVLQLLAQAAREQAAVGSGGGRGGEGRSPAEMQRMLAALAQGLAAGGFNLGGDAQGAGGGGGRDSSPRQQAPPHVKAPANGYAAAPPAGQAPAPGRPEPGVAGQSILPLAHQSRMERLFAAPPHHNSADPVPAIIKPPDRPGGEPYKHKPVSSGPNAFAAPSPAANLFQGFGGSGGEQLGGQRASPKAGLPGQPAKGSPQQADGGGQLAEKAAHGAQQEQQQQQADQEGSPWAARRSAVAQDGEQQGQEQQGQGQQRGPAQISLPPEADAALRLLAVLQRKHQQQCR